MKHYIEFYHLGIDWQNKGISPVIPICGNDGVFPLDNRLSLSNMIRKGYELCKSVDAVGFKITTGFSLLNTKPITQLIML